MEVWMPPRDNVWVDALWERPLPEPVIGTGTRLDPVEKGLLLAYAKGATHEQAAESAGLDFNTYKDSAHKNSTLVRLRTKLRVQSSGTMVARGYEQGALMLQYPDDRRPTEPPYIPEDLVRVLKYFTKGFLNPDIAQAEGILVAQARSQVARLGRALRPVVGSGGRTQMVSLGFQFGVLPGAQELPKRLVVSQKK
jgi:hypothetical protein